MFDLDGTLHEKSATERIIAAEQFEHFALAALGIELEAWTGAFSEVHNQRIEKRYVFAELGKRFGLVESLQAELFSHFDATVKAKVVAFSGALALVASCKARGWQVGIVTNGRDAFQRSKISGLGLLPSVDAVVTSAGFGVKKPDPRIFQACLASLDVSPAEAAFVGDDFAADMEPSMALGMLAVWKSDKHSPRVAFSSPSLDQIQSFLHRLL